MIKEYKEYDLILLYGSFQRCIIYLPICEELSNKFKIGLYILQPNKREKKRVSKTNNFFINKCTEFKNVDIINRDYNYKTKILIHQQKDYDEEDINFLKENIISNLKIGLAGVAMGNSYFKYLPYELDKLFVPDINFYKYRLKNYSTDNLNLLNKAVEIGSPFNKYQISNFPKIDYMVVSPTLFSFTNQKDKYTYMKRMNKLLKNIKKKDSNSLIAYKQHNADERYDSLINLKIYKFLNIFKFLDNLYVYKFILHSFNIASKLKIKLNILLEILICFEYKVTESLTTNLSSISDYHLVNAEIFFNSIQKGVITGRSNIIWHCLYNKVPVFNLIEESKPYLMDKMHMHSMKYFNVHFNKEFKFSNSFSLISETTRNKNIVEIINLYLSKFK